jgi:hypothetical protein
VVSFEISFNRFSRISSVGSQSHNVSINKIKDSFNDFVCFLWRNTMMNLEVVMKTKEI